MSDLLTKGEYEAIAKGLELPQNAYIDGAYRPAISGKTFDSLESCHRRNIMQDRCM